MIYKINCRGKPNVAKVIAKFAFCFCLFIFGKFFNLGYFIFNCIESGLEDLLKFGDVFFFGRSMKETIMFAVEGFGQSFVIHADICTNIVTIPIANFIVNMAVWFFGGRFSRHWF